MQYLTPQEQERLAYAEGYTETAAMLRRLDDAHHALGQATANLAIFEGVQAEMDDLMDERDDALAALDPLGCKLHDTRAELELTRDKMKTYRSALMAVEAEVPAHVRQFIREVLA
jgi:predicted  nucleic acid-binding Zn-ribbon protein